MGYGVMSVSMFLVGPSILLGLIDSPTITLIGLCIMGFGCGMIIIPVLPDMIESTEEKYPGMDKDRLHNNISGLFIAAQGLGETLGPVLGSVFEEFYGFRTSFDIIGCTLLVFMAIYFFLCGRSTLFTRISQHVLPASKPTEPLLDASDKFVANTTAVAEYSPPSPSENMYAPAQYKTEINGLSTLVASTTIQ